MTPTGKALLRKEALAKRALVAAEVRRDMAQSAVRHGIDLVRAGSVASVFLPIRGEPDTLPLIAALVAAGVRTALPVTAGLATPLRFRAWRPGEPLVRGAYGIETPLPSAATCTPDLLFVPLAAFDRRGYRLGYGGGYYDSTLAALRSNRAVLAVGLAFALQEVEAVPTEPHDERLDAVLTEHGLVTFGHP